MRNLIAVANLFLVPAGAAGEEVPPFRMLDDGSGEIQWSCAQAPVEKFTDAAAGKQGVVVEAKEPLDVDLCWTAFETNGVDLSQYDLIAFDYKLTGATRCVDLVIRQFPLNVGRLGHYYPVDEADTRGAWVTKFVPLEGPENLSLPLAEFDVKKRELSFRMEVEPSLEPTRLCIANLRVMKNTLGVRPLTFGPFFREAAGSVSYQYRIPVRNEAAKPVRVRIETDSSGIRNYKVRLGLESLTLQPQETQEFDVAIDIPAEVMAKADPFTAEELTVWVKSDDCPQLRLPTRLIATVPPPRFEHPALLGTGEQISGLLKKLERFPELKPVWEEILKRAEAGVQQNTPVPDYNGMGQTDCYVDKMRLMPLQRKGVPFREYVCTTCGRVYHGARFDSGFSGAGGWEGTHQKLGWEVLQCAFAYRVTGAERFGQRVATILKQYTEKYPTYEMIFPNDYYAPLGSQSPSSRRMGYTFFEHTWLEYISLTYDLVCGDDRVLKPGERAAFRERVLWPSAQKTTEMEIGLNNQQMFISKAEICAGYALDYPPLVYYGIHERRGLVPNLRQNLLPDGTWTESCNYNNLVASLLVDALPLMKRAGVDGYTPEVRRFYSDPAKMASPLGYQPNFGDGPGCLMRAWGGNALLPWMDTKDPAIGAVLARFGTQPLERWRQMYYLLGYTEAPPARKDTAEKFGCVDFPNAGYLFLRNDAEDQWLALVYGPQQGHGHYDRLGFELVGKGAMQAVDNGGGYGDAHIFDMSSLAHCTMLVDMQNHRPGSGRKLLWETAGPVKLASVGSRELAGGVWMERNIAMFAGAVLLVDGLQSAAEHTYDWAYHNLGAIVSGPKTDPAPPLATTGIYSYLKAPASARVSEPWSVEFRQGTGPGEVAGTGLALTQAGVPDTTLFTVKTTRGWGRDIPATTLLVRRKAKQTGYVTLLEPLAKGAAATYRLANVAVKEDQVVAEVQEGQATWIVTVQLGEAAKMKMTCEKKAP